MRKSFQPRSPALGFGIAVGVLGWISIASYWSTHNLVRSFDEVSQAHQALGKFQHIEVLIEAAESSVRGYVISGDTAELDPYQYAKLVIPYELRQLQNLTPFDPEKQKTFNEMTRLLANHLKNLTTLVTVRRSQGYDKAAQMISGDAGLATRTPMEHLLSKIQQEELMQLQHRWNHASSHALSTKATLLFTTLATLILLSWVFSLLRRETEVRHQAEITTLRTETFLDSIIERIPYMILVKEAAHLRMTLANKAASEWLGRPREELIHANELDLRSKPEALAAILKDREALRDGRLIDTEETLLLPGKEERILRTQKIPVPDSEGNPAYLLTISEDITQRKQTERMLQLSRDTALEAARLRSEFIRNMSHEFRTPLSIVIGMTSILLDSELTQEQRRFADTVRRAAEGLSHLTKSILDFSKIEAGTFTLESREVHVRQIVDDVVGMLNEQAKAKGVTLVSLITNDLPSIVRGDPVRLRQVLTQLMSNAVKFTEHGGIILRVTGTKQSETQIQLQFQIKDTGIGITEDVQKHLFEAFRQGDGSRTRRYGGTGLGLAISKRIVELMGGEIGFGSAPGEGTTFWFNLPFNKRHVHGPTVQVPSLPWTRARVLIVSENDTYRQLISQQLSGWALASESVSSAQEALELLRREQKAGRSIPIVLSDMHLSDMDSVRFARTVHGERALSATKFVVMTGDETALDASTSIPLGFASCLRMPPEPEELYQRLASLIDPPQHPTHQQHAA